MLSRLNAGEKVVSQFLKVARMKPESRSTMSVERKLGLAGTFAKAWIGSKLTYTAADRRIHIARRLRGVEASEGRRTADRGTDGDVFFQMPGASAREVEEAAIHQTDERLLWATPGVEYIYSTSSSGMSWRSSDFLSARTTRRISYG